MQLSTSWMSRAVRSSRELGLRIAFGRRGLVRVVNGVAFRALPQHRWYFAREYDQPVAQYFHQHIRPGMVCASVGANLGIYPLQFARWAGPTGRVYAFEPNPRTAAVLRRHVQINGVAEHIEVIERAVAEHPGEATFFAAGVEGMSRLGEPNPALSGVANTVTVRVDSLDHYFGTTGTRPDALMMDIEGFEIAALWGAQGLSAERPPITVVELHPNAWAVARTDRARLEKFLTEYRLQVTPLSGQRDPLAEYGHVALEPAGR